VSGLYPYIYPVILSTNINTVEVARIVFFTDIIVVVLFDNVVVALISFKIFCVIKIFPVVGLSQIFVSTCPVFGVTSVVLVDVDVSEFSCIKPKRAGNFSIEKGKDVPPREGALLGIKKKKYQTRTPIENIVVNVTINGK
jgi:hypothetical protein